ncbi:MAG: protein kinase, partial [Cyanobacteriota bacterium]|nr:protein kinase [Cyanobacteriota bacterium]
KAKELFEREAKRLYELDHPQIPRLYAYFEQKNSMYLVQQFIEGENLLEECLQQGPFDEQKIRELLQSLLPVLQYIHDNGLLHRDLKPENIMRRASTSSRGVGGNLVLIDFGGAKQITGTVQAAPGTIIYTPGYAAFEHINGQPRKASDLYSLGATCVRLLTGCFPYRVSSGNLQDEIYDADNGRWLWREYLQQQGKTVSHELGDILELLLKHFPQSRYQSAEEVLAALNARSPRSTVPPTVIHPPRGNVPKSPKRNRPAATKPSSNNPPRLSRAAFLKWAGFAGVGAIVAGVLGSLWSREGLRFRPLPTTNPFEFEVVTVNEKGEIINRQQRQAEFFTEDLGDGVALEMVAIPGGTFVMGSPETEEGRYNNEGPQREVSIQPFFMGKYEITQAQYQAIMGNNPSRFNTA